MDILDIVLKNLSFRRLKPNTVHYFEVFNKLLMTKFFKVFTDITYTCTYLQLVSRGLVSKVPPMTNILLHTLGTDRQSESSM